MIEVNKNKIILEEQVPKGYSTIQIYRMKDAKEKSNFLTYTRVYLNLSANPTEKEVKESLAKALKMAAEKLEDSIK